MRAYRPRDYLRMLVPRRASQVEVERNLEQLGRWTDSLFRVPGLGWRFGLDPLIGLIPGVGSTGMALLSLYILLSAVRYRVPRITLVRMGLYIAIDYIGGSIPLVGSLFDAWWKVNERNLNLIRRHARLTGTPASAAQARAGTRSDWIFVGVLLLVLVGLLVGLTAGVLYLVSLVIGLLR